MQKIPVHLLEAFVVFGESKNIIEAARRLNLSQPGMSKQLIQLEGMLPGKIFTLTGRKKMLTPFGQSLHKRIKDKVGSLQSEVKLAWALHSDPKDATIRILGRRGVLDRLPSKLSFKGSLFFEEAQNSEIIASLMQLKAEMGIAHSPLINHELIAKPLFKEEFQLVIPKKLISRHPQLNSALLQKLLELPCLAYKPKDELISALFRHHSVDPKELKVVRATASYQSIAEMAHTGLGWSILPSYFQIIRESCWQLPIPIKELPSRQFYLMYRKELSSLNWFKELGTGIQRCFS